MATWFTSYEPVYDTVILFASCFSFNASEKEKESHTEVCGK